MTGSASPGEWGNACRVTRRAGASFGGPDSDGNACHRLIRFRIPLQLSEVCAKYLAVALVFGLSELPETSWTPFLT
jgi:hypothetical protein